MALIGLQYQSMRLKFRGLLSNPFQFVSEAELDSFMGQLALDATGSVTAAQKSQADAFLVGALTSPAYTPTAADLTQFFPQLVAAAPVIVLALQGARYQQLKNQLTGALSIAGVRTEAQMLGCLAAYILNSPLSIITSVPVRVFLDAGKGTTQVTGISNWVDQTANGYSFAQATGAAQPILISSDATLNNQPTLTAVAASSQFMFGSSCLIATSYWRMTVAKYHAFASGDRMLDSGGHGVLLGQGAPNLALYELGGQSSTNGGFGAIDTWKCIEELQQNTIADALIIGSVTSTGTALGRVAPTTGMTIFAANGVFYTSSSIAMIVITDGIPTPAERANMRTFLTNKYLASLFT